MKTIIFVGSTNPVKVHAIEMAAAALDPQVTGMEVASGVDAQPRTDQETRTGARNRAKLAWAAAHQAQPKQKVLGAGLEGGVFTDDDGQLWSTVWAVVTDDGRTFFESNGARSVVPEPFAGIIQAGGEMGPIVEQMLGRVDVKHKEGMIGVITDNFVNRTEVYSAIAKIALGLSVGQNWKKEIKPTQNSQ